MGACGSSAAKEPDSAELDMNGTVPVYLNVYNLQGGKGGPPTAASASGVAGGAEPPPEQKSSKPRTLNQSLGFGFYHSGVELFGLEWSFGGDPAGQSQACGIFPVPPRRALPAPQFHEHILIGRLPPGTQRYDVERILRRLAPEWEMRSYNVLKHNCNHFSEAFLGALSEEFLVPNQLAPLVLPAHVNRAAKFGNAVVPERVLNAIMQNAPRPPADQGGVPAADGFAGGPVPAGNCNCGHSHGQGQGHSHGAPQESAPARQSAVPEPPRALPRTREDGMKLSIRQLRTVMFQHGIPWQDCVEKDDMVDTILAFNASLEDQ